MPHKQSINLPDDLYSWIETQADRDHISVSAEINLLLSLAMRCIEAGFDIHTKLPERGPDVSAGA